MKNPNALLTILLLALSSPAFALKSDATQVAHFSADHVSFNGQNGTTIYSGRVKMQQGTTQLIANQVVVYRDKEGGTDKAVATGNLAHYSTLPDNQKDPMDALGDKIEYYPKKHLAIILGNGTITQAKNSLQGPYIVYDMIKQKIDLIPALGPKTQDKKALIVLQPWDLPGSKKIK